jgi:hypothetical protein
MEVRIIGSAVSRRVIFSTPASVGLLNDVARVIKHGNEDGIIGCWVTSCPYSTWCLDLFYNNRFCTRLIINLINLLI